MNECSGLECLARHFVDHFVRGKLAKFLVNQRQEFLGGPWVALLDRP